MSLVERGAELRVLRKGLRLSLKAAALRLKCPKSTYADYEAGRNKPGYLRRQQIESLLGFTASQWDI